MANGYGINLIIAVIYSSVISAVKLSVKAIGTSLGISLEKIR